MTFPKLLNIHISLLIKIEKPKHENQTWKNISIVTSPKGHGAGLVCWDHQRKVGQRAFQSYDQRCYYKIFRATVRLL